MEWKRAASDAVQQRVDDLLAARPAWEDLRWSAATVLPWAAQRTLVEHLVVLAWQSTHEVDVAALLHPSLDGTASWTCLWQVVLAVALTSQTSSLPVPTTLSPSLLDPTAWTVNVSPEALAVEALRAARRGAVLLMRWASRSGGVARPSTAAELCAPALVASVAGGLVAGGSWGRMTEQRHSRRGVT